MQLELYNQAVALDEAGQRQPLSKFLTQRKVFITIDDTTEYKRCRVQSNRKGVVLRDVAKGAAINTKKQQLCQPGDFLVAEIDAKVGGYGFVPAELEGAIVSSHYYLFEVDEAQLLSRYLYYLAQSDIIQSQISSQGSTNYAAIRPKEFLAIEIPYVEPDEQRAIVARLDALTLESDEFGQEAAHQATLLTRLREAILREAVQGRLLPQDPTDEPAPALLARIRAEKQRLIKEKKLRPEKPLPLLNKAEVAYEVPQGWVWERVQTLCSHVVDCPHSTAKFIDIGYYCVDTTCISPDTIQFEKVRKVSEETFLTRTKTFKPRAGDILFTREGTIGTSLIIPPGIELCMGQRIMAFRLHDDILPAYFNYVIRSSEFVKQWAGKLIGTAAKHINVADLRAMLIPLPPLAEQRRIVVKVAELLAHCTALEADLARARAAASALHAAALREAFRPVPAAAVA